MKRSRTRPIPKERSELHSDTLYGLNAVAEALVARPVEYVLIAEGQHNQRVQGIIDVCRAEGVPLRFAPHHALDRLAGTSHHQNVVVVCSAKAYDELESLLDAAGKPLLVILDGVEDPANLGATVRTALAAGSQGIIIPKRRAAGLSPTVARAAAGALEHLKVARVPNLVNALMEMKERGVWVYGFEPQAKKSYLELDYTGPCAVVLGGEGHGLHRLVRETCDVLGHIPLLGPAQSLNVSVAAGIVLYEAVRQRSKTVT